MWHEFPQRFDSHAPDPVRNVAKRSLGVWRAQFLHPLPRSHAHDLFSVIFFYASQALVAPLTALTSMESDSSSSSIRSPDHPLVESDAKSPDIGALEYGSASPEPRTTWYTRVRNRAADKYPGAYGRALKWYRWTLGPRPKVDLPGAPISSQIH